MQKKFLQLIFLLFVLSNICFAKSILDEKSQKANKNDIIGAWQMVYQTISPIFYDDSLSLAGFQVYEFLENGTFKNISSRKSLKDVEVVSFLQRIPNTEKYKFIDNGLLVLENSRRDFKYIQVELVIENYSNKQRPAAPILKKGDLIFSYMDRKRNVYMQRYFRKIKL